MKVSKESRDSVEVRLAHLITVGLQEFAGCLGQSTASRRRFEGLARESREVYAEGRAWGAAPLAFRLAQACRDVFFIAGTLLRELDDFHIRPGPDVRALAEGVGRVAEGLQAAVDNRAAGQVPDAEAVAEARRRAREVRALYEEALEHLFKEADAVEALKRREMARHLWRLCEALARCFPAAEKF
jgi:hypothetical protein